MNVLVTGASRGIGRAVALAYARAGHDVFINFDKSAAQAKSLADEIIALGRRAETMRADVSRRDDARALVDTVVSRWGRLDVLVNNAGISRDRTILKMTEEEWCRVIDVNLSGAFWTLQAAARVMVPQKDGAIVNVASIMAVRGGIGCANYAASKAGLVALTKSAARELGRFNVRVNAVLPGYHPTDMNKSFPSDVVQAVLSEHILGRFPDMDELARFIVDTSMLRSVSGQVLAFESRVL
jgi:NAD(P)-dependent dehydrogenase (short-subunit alcohol dehydrogenase family)